MKNNVSSHYHLKRKKGNDLRWRKILFWVTEEVKRRNKYSVKWEHKSEMITAPLYTLPYLVFSVLYPLSPLTFLPSSFSFPSPSLILSQFIFLSPLLPSSFQSFSASLFSHRCSLYPLRSVWSIVSYFTFLPHFYPAFPVRLPLHVKYPLSILNLFFFFNWTTYCYFFLLLSACLSVSALGLFTYSLVTSVAEIY